MIFISKKAKTYISTTFYDMTIFKSATVCIIGFLQPPVLIHLHLHYNFCNRYSGNRYLRSTRHIYNYCPRITVFMNKKAKKSIHNGSKNICNYRLCVRIFTSGKAKKDTYNWSDTLTIAVLMLQF